MPIFEIQHPDGRSFEIDAPDQGAALSAFQNFIGPSNTPTQQRSGALDVASSLLGPVGQAANLLAKTVAPEATQEFSAKLGRFAQNVVTNPPPSISGMASLPKRVTETSNELQRTGEVGDAGPILEAGMMGLMPSAALRVGPSVAAVPKPVAPETSAILGGASDLYAKAREASIGKPLADGLSLESIAQSLRSELNATGHRPVPGVADATHKAIDTLERPATPGAPDVADLMAGRETLKLVQQGGGRDGFAAGRAIDRLDQYIKLSSPDAIPTLRAGDKEFSVGKTAERVEGVGERAELDANALKDYRSQMRTQTSALAKKNPYEGMTAAEQKALSTVAGGPLNRLLQPVAALDATRPLGAILHGMTAAGTGGTSLPLQLGAAVTGFAAKKGMEANMARRLASVSEMIRSRSAPTRAERMAYERAVAELKAMQALPSWFAPALYSAPLASQGILPPLPQGRR